MKKSRLRRVMIIVVSFIMVFAFSATAFAMESNTIFNEVVVVIDDDTSYEELMSATIVVVPENKLNYIKDYAKELVDNNIILHIQDTSLNKEELSQFLSIPKQTTDFYNDMEHIATNIYLSNSKYIFSYIYVSMFDDYGNEIKSSSFNKELLDIDDTLRSTREIYNVVIDEPNVNTSQRIPSNATYTYTDTVFVYNSSNTKIGEGAVTEYVYPKGYYIVNGIDQYVYDAVSRFIATPYSSTYVAEYSGRMHCNITGHTMLDGESLPSNSSSSTTLSLSSSGIGGSTTWTYTPDSQDISSSIRLSSRIADYTGNPRVARYGQSWFMEPGIRCSSTGGTGQRGVFSKITIPTIGFWGQTTNTATVEVGGWF